MYRRNHEASLLANLTCFLKDPWIKHFFEIADDLKKMVGPIVTN